MSDSPFNPDDPRLTAYVLGELSNDERADVEAHLAACPESRRIVDELRATTARLFEALQAEPAPALTDAQRRSIRRAAMKIANPPVPATAPPAPATARHANASRNRAAVTALLAVVTVSAAILLVLIRPLGRMARTDVADRLSVAQGELLAWNDASRKAFDPSGQPAPDASVLKSADRYVVVPHADPLVDRDQVRQLEVTPRRRSDELSASTDGLWVRPREWAAAVPANRGLGGARARSLGRSAGAQPTQAPSDGKTGFSRLVHQRTSGPLTSTGTPIAIVPAEEQSDPVAPFGVAGAPYGQNGGQPSPPPTTTGEALVHQPTSRPSAGAGTPMTTVLIGKRLERVPTTSLFGVVDPQNGGLPTQPPAARGVTNAPQRGGDRYQWGTADSFTAELDLPYQQGAFELGIPTPQITYTELDVTNLDRLRRKNATLYESLREGESDGTESYAPIVENPFVAPTEQPLSTFGLDVDTASYANVRRFLVDEGRWPPADAVRIEEMVNFFSYADPLPAGKHPLRVTLEAAACPWDTSHRLVRIGVKGREIDLADRPPTSLVFLIDTSGSMRDENKLPLVKQSLRLLVDEMTENDRIALVTYSTTAGLLLDSTSGEHREAIMGVIDSLQANGSTNGEAGLKLAYDVASQHFIETGANRVILCTDGDFNVGESADAPLVRMISEKRDTGVLLSICGFGTGNLKDAKLEQIADRGNGQYHYVDGIGQARKVFLNELSGMLYTIAKDVKLQVEFNPAEVAAYRLLGYENRALAAEDFNNDRIDAGDLGAGHSVTALYEIVPAAELERTAEDAEKIDAAEATDETSRDEKPVYTAVVARHVGEALVQHGLDQGLFDIDVSKDIVTVRGMAEDRAQADRYLSVIRSVPVVREVRDQLGVRQKKPAPQPRKNLGDNLLVVHLRYKQPRSDESTKLEFPLVDEVDAASPSTDLEWAAAVASFGMILRNSLYRGQSSIEGVLELARGAKGNDPTGERQEFIELVLEARALLRKATETPTPRPPQLSSLEARDKAAVGGRYRDLLDKFGRPDDFDRYGDFYDAGRKNASPDGEHPAGFWVYVFPHWYIWSETTRVSQASPAKEP